jgi:hypothetical protein
VEIHEQRIAEAIKSGHLVREGIWTDSIAVGTEAFVKEITSRNKKRKRFHAASEQDGTWHVREDEPDYAGSLDPK